MQNSLSPSPFQNKHCRKSPLKTKNSCPDISVGTRVINQSPAVPPVLTHMLCPLCTYCHTQTVVNEVPAPSYLL